jgi:hypothetical protein
MDTQSSSSSEALQSAQPQSSGPKKILIAIAAIVIAGLAIGAYIISTTQKEPDDSDSPPSLTTEGGLKGSFMETNYGFLEFEEKDGEKFKQAEKDLIAKGAANSELKSGINYVHASENLTAPQVIDLIDPVAKKAFIAYYNPGENGKEKKFYTYPQGKFSGTGLLEETESIPANRGFIIIVEKPAKVYKVRTSSQKPASSASLISPDTAGWVLTTLASENTGKELSPYKNRLETAWTFTNGTPQSKIDTSKLDASDPAKEYLVWLRLKQGKNEELSQELPQPEKSPTIEKVTPFEILIPEPNDTPKLVPLTKVQITGTYLKSVESVTFEDKNISATIKPIANYLAEMELSIQPSTENSMKTFTVKTQSGKTVEGKLVISYEKPMLAPKVTQTEIVEVTPDEKMYSLKIKGENLISSAIKGVTFKDTNISAKIGSFASNEEFTAALELDPENIQPGLKEFSIKANGTVYESAVKVPLVKKVVTSLETQFDPVIQIQSGGLFTLGTPFEPIDLYGVNLSAISIEKQLIVDGKVLPAVVNPIDKNHMTLKLEIPVDFKIGSTVIPLAFNAPAVDANGLPFGKNGTVKVGLTIQENIKAPKVIETSPKEVESAATSEIIITATNIDDDTKITIEDAGTNAENAPKITLKEIKPSFESMPGMIKFDVTANSNAQGDYTIKLQNAFGAATAPLTVKPPLAT